MSAVDMLDKVQTGAPSSATDLLVSYVTDSTYESLGSSALEAAVRPIVDTVGVILAGLGSEVGQGMTDYAKKQTLGAQKGAWTPVKGVGVSAEVAACINGALAHSLDYDDTVLGAGHPSGVVLAALLAACDPALPGNTGPLTGRKLLEAFTLGFDVHVKMARALGLKHYKHGWHTTSTAGAFAATAAVAHARGYDREKTAIAFGMTASMISGIQRNFGTATKPLHSGLAARAGVMACDLADVGYTASANVFDGPRSVIDMYGLGEKDMSQFEKLGGTHAIIDPGVALKRFPACYTTHRAIQATLNLCNKHDLKPEQIKSVRGYTPVGALMYLVKHPPRTGLEGKFSVEYLVACAVHDRDVGLNSFSDEAVLRPGIKDLLKRIEVTEEEWCRPDDPQGLRSSPATGGFIEVHITTTDGTKLVEKVFSPEGSVEFPLTWDGLGQKFVDCAIFGGINPKVAKEVFDALRNLQSVPDVHAVLRKLIPEG